MPSVRSGKIKRIKQGYLPGPGTRSAGAEVQGKPQQIIPCFILVPLKLLYPD